MAEAALNSTVVGGGEFHMNAGVTETFWEWEFLLIGMIKIYRKNYGMVNFQL